MSKSRRVAEPILKSGIAIVVKAVPLPLPSAKAIDVIKAEPDLSVEKIVFNIDANKNIMVTPEEFWDFMTTLAWERFSRSIYCTPQCYSSLNKISKVAFHTHFSRYANVLKQKIDETGAFGILERTLADSERAGLIAHVVALGETVYASVCADPYFIASYVAATANNDRFKNPINYLVKPT